MELIKAYLNLQFQNGRINTYEYIKDHIGKTQSLLPSHNQFDLRHSIDPFLPEGFEWMHELQGGLIIPIEQPKTMEKLQQESDILEKMAHMIKCVWMFMAILLIITNLLVWFSGTKSPIGLIMWIPFTAAYYIYRYFENKKAKIQQTLEVKEIQRILEKATAEILGETTVEIRRTAPRGVRPSLHSPSRRHE